MAPYPSVADYGLTPSPSSPSSPGARGPRLVLHCHSRLRVTRVTMGPIMFDLWCLKGIGNANFYYAVTLIFAARPRGPPRAERLGRALLRPQARDSQGGLAHCTMLSLAASTLHCTVLCCSVSVVSRGPPRCESAGLGRALLTTTSTGLSRRLDTLYYTLPSSSTLPTVLYCTVV